jgi:hypothetical protein
MRSCGPPTRSVGPTNRSAGLLIGRTYLSRTVVSLVGGDPRLPMSHREKVAAAVRGESGRRLREGGILPY